MRIGAHTSTFFPDTELVARNISGIGFPEICQAITEVR